MNDRTDPGPVPAEDPPAHDLEVTATWDMTLRVSCDCGWSADVGKRQRLTSLDRLAAEHAS